MSSPSVLKAGSPGGGRFVWSTIVGEGSRLLLLSVQGYLTHKKHAPP